MEILYRKTYSTADCQVGTSVEDEEMTIGLGRIRQTRDAEFAYSQHRDSERDPAQARLRRADDPGRSGDHQQIPSQHAMGPLPEKVGTENRTESEAAGTAP